MAQIEGTEEKKREKGEETLYSASWGRNLLLLLLFPLLRHPYFGSGAFPGHKSRTRLPLYLSGQQAFKFALPGKWGEPQGCLAAFGTFLREKHSNRGSGAFGER